MNPFVFHPEAEQDIDGAAVWYETQQPGLGRQFRQAADKALDAIQLNPYAYSRIHGSYRRFVLNKFPYSVIYWLLPNAIYILACFHSHRDPKRWRRRL